MEQGPWGKSRETLWNCEAHQCAVALRAQRDMHLILLLGEASARVRQATL
jgi:hypothetical protein